MAGPTNVSISVRSLRESDLLEADRIMRLAYDTYLGLPGSTGLVGDVNYVSTRWLVDPAAAFAAEVNGELAGSSFATSWGSVGFVGPLSVRPDLWNRGVGTRLMESTMKCFAKWGTKHVGLSTFAHGSAQVHLYQKFGFCTRSLSVIMSKPAMKRPLAARWSRFSALSMEDQRKGLADCSKLTNAIYEGLSLEGEIRVVNTMRLGDTVLLWDGPTLVGFAVCHWGPGTEAGSGTYYIRFGAIRPSPEAGQNFDRLLDTCEVLAASQDLQTITAGANTDCHEAYRAMQARGFYTTIQHVAMDRPDEPAYHRPGVYIIDGWR
jgi:GNAT superfamily N-acetyltransferase